MDVHREIPRYGQIGVDGERDRFGPWCQVEDQSSGWAPQGELDSLCRQSAGSRVAFHREERDFTRVPGHLPNPLHFLFPVRFGFPCIQDQNFFRAVDAGGQLDKFRGTTDERHQS
ncbi:MAG: hypothetical protein C0467_30570 [Planctomycetaceae bacterium]|nr:hypothetical protein [Planctomycetaceae bacterium]